MHKLTKKEWAWAMYDFGNSAYALIVVTIFFPLFFAEYIVPGKLTTALWGVSVASSILLVGLTAPFIGAFTDKEAKRKSYFIFFSIITIAGTMMLSFSANTPSYIGILIFVIVNSVFGLALSLYDSFIVIVPKKKEMLTTLSGLGWAIGYIGGPLCLGIAWLFMGGKLPTELLDFKILFIVTGFFFFFCSLPAYFYLPEGKTKRVSPEGLSSFRAVRETLRSWRNMKHIFIFLLAMYFIMDGLTTVVYFVSLFAKVNLGLDVSQIVLLLLTVQIVGIPATIIMSFWAEKFGEIKFLILCSGIWIIIIVAIFFSSGYNTFIWISALTGVVIGSTPAIARGFLGKIIPAKKRAEFFGFNTLAGRIATLIGPLIYGIAASIWNMKVALFTIIPFFIAGAILLACLQLNFRRWQSA